MLIEKITLLNAKKIENGYSAEIELESADGLDFSGSITFDSDWNYKLGFLNTFINDDDDKYFVNEVLSSEDFKNDVLDSASSHC
jgi:hypothetical protein